MTKAKKATKIQHQKRRIEHLTKDEKYQAVVDLISKIVVDITFKEFEEERKISLDSSIYCLPCLGITIKSGL